MEIVRELWTIFLLDVNMKRIVEPGDFDLMVGPNSPRTANVTLTVEPR